MCINTKNQKCKKKKKTTPRHNINKWFKISNKEKFLKGGQF